MDNFRIRNITANGSNVKKKVRILSNIYPCVLRIAFLTSTGFLITVQIVFSVEVPPQPSPYKKKRKKKKDRGLNRNEPSDNRTDFEMSPINFEIYLILVWSANLRLMHQEHQHLQ